MPYKLIYSSIYNIEYSEILTDLSDYSSKTAINFKNELEQQISILTELPRLYPEYEYNYKIKLAPLRKMVVRNYSYIVFYNVSDDKKTVTLYDIVHTSRDVERIVIKKFK